MVLDESALEAMLARQRAADRGHEPAPAVRTVKTDEFEVYERRPEEAAPPPPQTPPPQAPHVPPAEAPGAAEPQGFEELPGRQPQRPEPATARRPQVWPPIQRRAPEERGGAVPAPGDAPAGHGGAAGRRPPAAEPSQHAAEAAAAPTAGAGGAVAGGAPGHAAQGGTPGPGDPTQAPARPRTHAPAPRGPPHAFPDLQHDGTGCRLAIVQALFNQEITDAMAEQAVARAEAAGATATRHQVAGVFDLPLLVQHLARRKDVDAIVAIGCVVQGATKHDELITSTTVKTLQEISLATDTPVALGITGPGMSWEQAQERVGNGAHAVDAALALWRAVTTV